MQTTVRRYASLDAWRGIAALAVVLFHSSNTIVSPDSLAGRALLAGWLGVFIFFPISGYCILAALHSPANRTVGSFLTRRWRRIMPPYWASIGVALVIAFAALPFNRASASDVVPAVGTWPAIVTLTQVFTVQPHAINPVYWSLCYEEQFYLVMALLLLVTASRRAALLLAITAAAAAYATPAWSWRVPGLFLEYWMCFATGCAAYLWLHDAAARRAAAAIFAIVAVMTIATANAALFTSLATAVAMTWLARHDTALVRYEVVSVLRAIGTFSFSLYLTHVPIGGRVTNLLERFDVPPAVTIVVSVATSVVAAWLFYLAFERRALTARTGRADRTDPVAAAA